MICLAREIPVVDNALRSQVWKMHHKLELWRKTLGLVGLGRISTGVPTDPWFQSACSRTIPSSQRNSAAAVGMELTTLESLLALANFVSLHAPLSQETRHLIGAAELAQMRRLPI